MEPRRTIDDVLAEARRDLRRVSPSEAWAAAREGAVLVDVRSEDERRRQGVLLPGALHHPLSVLHWRLDPAVPTSNPGLPLDARAILVSGRATRRASRPLSCARSGSGWRRT